MSQLFKEQEEILRQSILGGQAFREAPESYREYNSNLRSSLRRSLEDVVPESTLTGNKIPINIELLHFEYNLNQSIDRLVSLEGLIHEKTDLLFMQKESLYMSNNPESQLDEEEQDLDLDNQIEHINYRYYVALNELLQYVQASRIAAKYLYDIETDIDYQYGYLITRAREVIVELGKKYRLKAADKRVATIPISLKWAKNTEGEFLIKHWHKEELTRNNNNNLTKDSLRFNLKKFAPLTDLGKHYVRGIGVQIIDNKSASTIPAELPNFWSLELLDDDGGIPIDSGDNLTIKPLKYYNIIGSTDNHRAVWSDSPHLINIEATREWSLKDIKCNREGVDIVDIILYIELSYDTNEVE